MEILNTKDRILDVARGVFYKKGLEGARMQEIADLAGVNKAMLHYYFNSKEQLFNMVFEKAFGVFVGRISELLNSSDSLEEKISAYVEHTIGSLQNNPGITSFVIRELNMNPGRISELFAGKGNIDFSVFNNQVKTRYKNEIDAEMLFTDMVALCIYPFIAQPILQKLLKKDEAAFGKFIQKRKKWIKRSLLPKTYL